MTLKMLTHHFFILHRTSDRRTSAAFMPVACHLYTSVRYFSVLLLCVTYAENNEVMLSLLSH